VSAVVFRLVARCSVLALVSRGRVAFLFATHRSCVFGALLRAVGFRDAAVPRSVSRGVPSVPVFSGLRVCCGVLSRWCGPFSLFFLVVARGARRAAEGPASFCILACAARGGCPVAGGGVPPVAPVFWRSAAGGTAWGAARGAKFVLRGLGRRLRGACVAWCSVPLPVARSGLGHVRPGLGAGGPPGLGVGAPLGRGACGPPGVLARAWACGLLGAGACVWPAGPSGV